MRWLDEHDSDDEPKIAPKIKGHKETHPAAHPKPRVKVSPRSLIPLGIVTALGIGATCIVNGAFAKHTPKGFTSVYYSTAGVTSYGDALVKTYMELTRNQRQETI